MTSNDKKLTTLTLTQDDDDDDFQTIPISLSQIPKPLKPSNSFLRSSKKPRLSSGKENTLPHFPQLNTLHSSSPRPINISNSIHSSESDEDDFEAGEELNLLMDLCEANGVVSNLSLEQQHLHTNHCLDRDDDLLLKKSTLNESASSEPSTVCRSTVVADSCYIRNDLVADVSAENHEKRGSQSDKGCLPISLNYQTDKADNSSLSEHVSSTCDLKMGFKLERGNLSNSIESRLLASRVSYSSSTLDQSDGGSSVEFEPGEQLLMKLCSEAGDRENMKGEGNAVVNSLVQCPICGLAISHLSEEDQQVHTNDCLDRDELQKALPSADNKTRGSPQRVVDVTPVLRWLQGLGLSKYEEAFVKEEIDWDTLQWLTEEDLVNMGVSTLGPRKKIVHALKELRKSNNSADHGNKGASNVRADENRRLAGNKLITEFFPGSSVAVKNRDCARSVAEHGLERRLTGSGCKDASKVCSEDYPRSLAQKDLERKKRNSDGKRNTARHRFGNGTVKDIPLWCCIPGTPFRVDAFRYLRGDCSHWFLTHFHMDHYQGLTKSFCRGKIYCSAITAKLVNMKMGIPWDRIQVLPINQKINIAGTNVTFLDANHCPGSIIILFEPPNGKAVLHTGDFRFGEELAKSLASQSCAVHTLILDTTYCNPQYDFPKQEAVIQFVIEAIQAEAFNPKTLFLIGSYTIGKERLFLEVARCLRKKVYVGPAKLRLLDCLGIAENDMKWFTSNEGESCIHVVPMWTIASFKRMKHISNQYMGRFNLIVAFSPTGWTFGKGRKKSQGRRCQQGTVIRYEVPYSEHSSFTELKEFVQLVSPENIIPSVNNDSPESADAMISYLLS